MKKHLFFFILFWTSIARAQQTVGSLNLVPVTTPSAPTSGAAISADSSQVLHLIPGSGGSVDLASIIATGNALTALNSITAAASTNLTLNAGSGNSSVVVVPSGSGTLAVNQNSAAVPTPVAAGTALQIQGGNSASPSVEIRSFAGTAAYKCYTALGSAASPLAINTLGINLGTFDGGGFDGTNWASCGAIIYNSAASWTTSSHPAYLQIGTVPAGSTTTVYSLFLSAGGNTLLGANNFTDNSNGLLQLISSTSSTAGIVFGNDTSGGQCSIYRSAANTISSPAKWIFAGTVTAAGLTLTAATYKGTVTLIGGAGTITSTAITSASTVILTLTSASGANSYPQVLVGSGSATVTGLATDAGTYNWRIIN
jgi:hypothetical protein